MAKPKTKSSVTKAKTAIPAGPAPSEEDVPVEDQAKPTKKKGRPAKTKPIADQPTQEVSGDLGTADDMDLAEEEEEDSPEVDELTEATELQKKPAAAPGSRTKQKRSGLTFSIKKMKETLRKGKITLPCPAGCWTIPTFSYPGNYSLTKNNQWLAPIYLTGVLEYLTAEVLELAGDMAKNGKKNRIAPRHIMLAIRTDDEVSFI